MKKIIISAIAATAFIVTTMFFFHPLIYVMEGTSFNPFIFIQEVKKMNSYQFAVIAILTGYGWIVFYKLFKMGIDKGVFSKK